jgi:hypothetical protein
VSCVLCALVCHFNSWFGTQGGTKRARFLAEAKYFGKGCGLGRPSLKPCRKVQVGDAIPKPVSPQNGITSRPPHPNHTTTTLLRRTQHVEGMKLKATILATEKNPSTQVLSRCETAKGSRHQLFVEPAQRGSWSHDCLLVMMRLFLPARFGD